MKKAFLLLSTAIMLMAIQTNSFAQIPVADFIASTTNGCAGGTCISFTDLSTNSPTTWAWHFPGGTPTTSTAQNPSCITYNVSGTYDVTLIATNGFGVDSITKPAYITVNPSLPVSVTIAAAFNPICAGSSATFTATPTNGGVTPAYQWKLNGVNVGVNSPTYTNTTLVNGDQISCVMTSNATCATGNPDTSNIITMTVLSPTVTISPSSPNICTGGSVVLSASGGTTYTWAPGTGLSSTTGSVVTASPSSTTTYTVTGTITGCTGTTTVTVTVGTLPTITANATSPVICNGTCTYLNAGGANTYLWAPGGLSGSTVNVCPTTTTTYSVTGTTSGGCSASSTVTVTVNPNPTPTVTVTPATCGLSNGTATANGGSTYAWSNLATTQTISNLPAGTYTVTVSNGGCSATATGTVTTTGSLTMSMIATNASCSTCSDGTATVNPSGTPPYSYTWSNAAVTQTISGLTAGIYYVTVTDGSGCSGTDSCTVGIGNCSANFILVADTITLHLYYAVNLSYGVPPLSYFWSWGDGGTSNIAYPSHTYAIAGFYNICVMISDSVGCSDNYCFSSYLAKSVNTIVTVIVIDSTQLGVQEINNNLNLSLFPNPFSNSSTLQLSSPVINATLTIYDMLGKKIQQMKNLNGKEIIIQRESMKAGMYFFRIEDKSGVVGKGKMIVE